PHQHGHYTARSPAASRTTRYAEREDQELRAAREYARKKRDGDRRVRSRRCARLPTERSFRRTRMASDRVHAKRPGRIRGVARHAREHHIANKKRLSTSTISVNLDAAFRVP